MRRLAPLALAPLLAPLALSAAPAAQAPAATPTTQPAAATAPAARTPTDHFRAAIRRRPADAADLASYPVRDGPELDVVRRWVAANADSLGADVPTGGSLPVVPVGAVTFRPATAGAPGKLYLHVLDHHASGKVVAYGLPAAAVARAYRLADPTVPLVVEGTARDTAVVLTAKNAKAPDPLDTVVVLEMAAPGGPASVPIAVRPRADGSVLLHARDAVVVARSLRYEPEPNKDTLGYWTNPADWAYWELDLPKPATFDVELLQGCGKNSGGSDVEVAVGGAATLSMVVQDTGGFQNFVPRTVGRITLPAGTHRLVVRAKQKKGAAVMDLRQVTLTPVP